MKIRHPLLIQAVSLVSAWIIRLWMRTLSYRYRPLGPNLDPLQRGMQVRCIYAFWHEYMLLPAYQHARPDIYVLISQHADGQLIAGICRHLGLGTVRGSTTRGGPTAVRRMLRLGRTAHLAITPDGPRGPRRKVQQGLVYLAARTGLPIVPVGVGFSKEWRMRSWDRFALPKPWCSAVCVTGDPIQVLGEADHTLLKEYVERVEMAMQHVTDLAERWAVSHLADATIKLNDLLTEPFSVETMHCGTARV
jgi:lysophospholipid acyltransferase (LPLAT)-like uncharacterized protein